jgi:hypothetical protein
MTITQSCTKKSQRFTKFTLYAFICGSLCLLCGSLCNSQRLLHRVALRSHKGSQSLLFILFSVVLCVFSAVLCVTVNNHYSELHQEVTKVYKVYSIVSLINLTPFSTVIYIFFFYQIDTKH